MLRSRLQRMVVFAAAAACMVGSLACTGPFGAVQAAKSDPLDARNFEDQWRQFQQEAVVKYGLNEAQAKAADAVLVSCLSRATAKRELHQQALSEAKNNKDAPAREKADAGLKTALEKLADECVGRIDAIATIEQVEKAAQAGFESPRRKNPPPRPEVGFRAPPFELKMADGKAISLESLKGKTVVLQFWATWCGFCKKSLPEIQKLYEAVKDKPNVVLYGVNCAERPNNPEPVAFAKEQGCQYEHALKGDGVGAVYEVHGYPKLFVIGPDGKIIFKEDGYKADVAARLVPIIEKALAGPAKPAKSGA